MRQKKDELPYQPEHFETDTDDVKQQLHQVAEANARAGHLWRQRGNQLICTSCLSQHATFLPPGIRLVGLEEDGRPKFEVA